MAWRQSAAGGEPSGMRLRKPRGDGLVADAFAEVRKREFARMGNAKLTRAIMS